MKRYVMTGLSFIIILFIAQGILAQNISFKDDFGNKFLINIQSDRCNNKIESFLISTTEPFIDYTINDASGEIFEENPGMNKRKVHKIKKSLVQGVWLPDKFCISNNITA